jgi:serine/threonine protein kinase
MNTADDEERTTRVLRGELETALDSSLDDTLVRRDRSRGDAQQGPLLWKGEAVDHYQVKMQLGRGAMGEVYLARDTKLGRNVALKVMRPHIFKDAEAAARFQHEAHAMARINHPNVVTIHGVGEHKGVPYVAMEFLRGQPLNELLEGLSQDKAIDVALSVAEALREAHSLGIVHRDLKPENVIASPDGRVRVVDFGLAKMIGQVEAAFADTPMPTASQIATRVGSHVGTPLYMAPEQWVNDPITTATDVWALGVMLHEMLTGKVPFRGSHIGELASRVLNPMLLPMRDERVPDDLWNLSMRCLERTPSERPGIDEIITTLRRIRRGESATAEVVVLPAPEPTKSGWLLALFAAALLGGGVAIGTLLTGDPQAAPSAPPPPTLPTLAATPAPSATIAATPEVTASAAPEPTASPAPSASASSPISPISSDMPAPPPAPQRPPRPRPSKTADVFAKPPPAAGY